MSTEADDIKKFEGETKWKWSDYLVLVCMLPGAVVAAVEQELHTLFWVLWAAMWAAMWATIATGYKIRMWRARIEHLKALRACNTVIKQVNRHLQGLDDKVNAALDGTQGQDRTPPAT
jgi:hypothetical protein